MQSGIFTSIRHQTNFYDYMGFDYQLNCTEEQAISSSHLIKYTIHHHHQDVDNICAKKFKYNFISI